MKTALELNQYVTALASAQGMTKGRAYKVCGVFPSITPFGTFVTYAVREVSEVDDSDFGYDTGTGPQEVLGAVLNISNGHLLLQPVRETAF